MRTRVKFCGLVDVSDVDAAVALGADALGFVFYPRSPRHVTIEQAATLRRRLPSWVSAVGLFVNAPAEEIAAVHRAVGLDVVQFHGDETPSDCVARAAGLPFWRAVRMKAPGDLLESESQYGQAEALLLDAFVDGYGGSGHSFDWSWIAPQRKLPVILSGGLKVATVHEAIVRVRPVMVDVSSGIQTSDPRRKDPDLMARFMAEVQRADLAPSDPTQQDPHA